MQHPFARLAARALGVVIFALMATLLPDPPPAKRLGGLLSLVVLAGMYMDTRLVAYDVRAFQRNVLANLLVGLCGGIVFTGWSAVLLMAGRCGLSTVLWCAVLTVFLSVFTLAMSLMSTTLLFLNAVALSLSVGCSDMRLVGYTELVSALIGAELPGFDWLCLTFTSVAALRMLIAHELHALSEAG